MKINKEQIKEETKIHFKHKGEFCLSDISNITENGFSVKWSFNFYEAKFDSEGKPLNDTANEIEILGVGDEIRIQLKRKFSNKIGGCSLFIDRLLRFSDDMKNSFIRSGLKLEKRGSGTELSTYSEVGARFSNEAGKSYSYCGDTVDVTLQEKEIISSLFYFYSESEKLFKEEYEELSSYFKGKAGPAENIAIDVQLYNAELRRERDDALKIAEKYKSENENILRTIRNARNNINWVQDLFSKIID